MKRHKKVSYNGGIMKRYDEEFKRGVIKRFMAGETTATHRSVADGQGAATKSKAGLGNFTKAVADPTSGPFPCTYPIVNP